MFKIFSLHQSGADRYYKLIFKIILLSPTPPLENWQWFNCNVCAVENTVFHYVTKFTVYICSAGFYCSSMTNMPHNWMIMLDMYKYIQLLKVVCRKKS